MLLNLTAATDNQMAQPTSNINGIQKINHLIFIDKLIGTCFALENMKRLISKIASFFSSLRAATH